MSQDYTDSFPVTGKPSEDIIDISENFETLRSSFSGTTFPSSPVPATGQPCWRTDRGLDADTGKTGKMYIYSGNTSLGETGWITEEEFSSIAQEVINSRGSKASLDARLDVITNEDGTLKDSVAVNNSEWVTTGLTDTYVSTTSFTVEGDQTDIFAIDKRIKANLSASTVYSEITNSVFTTLTTVTIADAVLDNTLTSIQPSLINPIDNDGSMTAKMVGALDLTSNQTIDGVKTFSVSPIVPTATLGDDSTKAASTAFVLANSSNSIALPTKTSPSSITVDGTLMTLSSPVAGTDYYFSKTAIQTVKDTNTVGGFHYGLVAEAEAVSGNKTEADMVEIRGINAHSIWTNWFRPIANPEGMVYIGGKWYDIYLLNSEHITNGTSKALATIAGGTPDYGRAIPKIPLAFGGDGSTNYGKFTWFQACEIAKSHSKELISYAEFPTIAYGVVEGTDCSSLEVVQGRVEHYATLTSKYGIEQATGVQYVWGADANAVPDCPTWQAVTDGRGSIYAKASGLINAVKLGGDRSDGVHAGSRNSYWFHPVWGSGLCFGCRFSCSHKTTI